MREIKFRVWDKRDNEMVEVRQLNWEPEMNISIIGCWHEDALRFHLMQGTGLLDRNSVEIYEEDIVEITATKRRSLIVYEDGAFRLQEDDVPLWELADTDNTCVEIEIIGNIHENPELLEAP